jgi:hypothetical protein
MGRVREYGFWFKMAPVNAYINKMKEKFFADSAEAVEAGQNIMRDLQGESRKKDE